MACSKTALSSLSSHVYSKAEHYAPDATRHSVHSIGLSKSRNNVRNLDREFEAFVKDSNSFPEEDFSSAWSPELSVSRPQIKKRYHQRALPGAEPAVVYSGTDDNYGILPTKSSAAEFTAEFLAEQGDSVQVSRTQWDWARSKSTPDGNQESPASSSKQEALRKVAKSRLSSIAAHFDQSDGGDFQGQWDMESAFQGSSYAHV